MTVSIHGKDPRLRYCKDYLLRSAVGRGGKLLLLPIPSSRDGEHVTGTDERIDEVCAQLLGGDIIVGYGLPRAIRTSLASKGVFIIDVEHDEEYLMANANLTAIGTLGRILTEESAAPCELSVGIIGYGRIGQRLLYSLAFLGARVKVFTSKKELATDLCMLGISGADSLSLEKTPTAESFSGLDILINTAPARLIPACAAEALTGVRVIELAGGDNIPAGITYERFASVPAEMYPKSAGKALSDSIFRMLGQTH